MPPEEKEKIAIVPLCRNIGEIIALNGIIFLLKVFGLVFQTTGLWEHGGMDDHSSFDVWYIEKSQRYRKK